MIPNGGVTEGCEVGPTAVLSDMVSFGSTNSAAIGCFRRHTLTVARRRWLWPDRLFNCGYRG
jgi:hypothetical protein